jgi:hypothetical protein
MIGDVLQLQRHRISADHRSGDDHRFYNSAVSNRNTSRRRAPFTLHVPHQATPELLNTYLGWGTWNLTGAREMVQ